MKLEHIEYLVIHHSWSADKGTLDWTAIRKYHIEENGWDDIGYHFGIEKVNNDYAILTGRHRDVVGAHCLEKGMNKKSLGICVIGNYDPAPPPQEAMDMLVTLCVGLCREYELTVDKIVPHHEYASYKTCPGTKFPMDELKKRVGSLI